MDEFQNNYAEYKKPESLHPTKREYCMISFVENSRKYKLILSVKKKKNQWWEKMQEGGITESWGNSCGSHDGHVPYLACVDNFVGIYFCQNINCTP